MVERTIRCATMQAVHCLIFIAQVVYSLCTKPLVSTSDLERRCTHTLHIRTMQISCVCIYRLIRGEFKKSNLTVLYSRNFIMVPHLRGTIYGRTQKVVAPGRIAQSVVRGHGIVTRSSNILSFLHPLFQEGHLSVTGESMCTKYWLTA